MGAGLGSEASGVHSRSIAGVACNKCLQYGLLCWNKELEKASLMCYNPISPTCVGAAFRICGDGTDAADII